MDQKGQYVQIWPNLDNIWPHLVMKFFLVELGKKLSRYVGLVLRVALSKKISYWTWQSANFCTFLVIARSNNSFFYKATLKTNPTGMSD